MWFVIVIQERFQVEIEKMQANIIRNELPPLLHLTPLLYKTRQQLSNVEKAEVNLLESVLQYCQTAPEHITAGATLLRCAAAAQHPGALRRLSRHVHRYFTVATFGLLAQ